MTALAERLDVECERQKSKKSPNFWPEQLGEQSCHHLEQRRLQNGMSR